MGSKSVTFKQNAIVYGVKIDESEADPTKRVSYTDDAKGMVAMTIDKKTGVANYGTWKSAWIFDKIFPVMLKTDGTVDYKLDINDQTKKATGGTSDVDNLSYDGNAMVEWDKFYTKFSMSGEDECIQISDTKLEGFEAIGFIVENKKETSKIFSAMFGGFVDDNGKLRSIAGQYCNDTLGYMDSYNAALKNGERYDIDFPPLVMLKQAVFFALFKTCYQLEAMGISHNYTKATYVTSGQLKNTGAISRNPNYNYSKFMYIENGITVGDDRSNQIQYWVHGSQIYRNNVSFKMEYPYYGGTTSVPNNPWAGTNTMPDGIIKKMRCGNSFGRFPVDLDGTASTYETLEYHNCYQGTYYGFQGCLTGITGYSWSQGDNNISGRLTYIPKS